MGVSERRNFSRRLGDPTPDYDAIAFAVKNLGFIKFQIIEQSIIEIELHPRTVELPALLAVQQQLLPAGSSCSASGISIPSGSPRSRPRPSRRSRGCPSCARRYSPRRRIERFMVEPQDFGMLFHEDENKLRPLAQKWRVSFAPFRSEHHHRWRCATIVAAAGDRRRQAAASMSRFGALSATAIAGSAAQYRVNGIGEKVENMPDKDYGGWASRVLPLGRQYPGSPATTVVTAAMQYRGRSRQAAPAGPLRAADAAVEDAVRRDLREPCARIPLGSAQTRKRTPSSGLATRTSRRREISPDVVVDLLGAACRRSPARQTAGRDRRRCS